MLRATESSHKAEELSAGEIRAHLERLLASPAFRSSKRCQRFLAYVVGEALDGKAGSLKERTLAIEVFDRAESFHSGDDTIVRVGAREVRKRLAQYYTTANGAHEKMRIELPPGSYVPEFVPADTFGTVMLEVSPSASGSAASPPIRKPSGKIWILALACVVAVAATLVYYSGAFTRRSAFEEFWAPMWQGSGPVLIAMAHPLVYHASSRAIRLNEERLGSSPVPSQRPLQLPPKELDGSDIIPVPDQYVGYGDTVAAAEISVLLARHSKDSRLRPADQLEFADFREMPAVFIGAFTNRWSMEFSQKLRLHFVFDAQGVPAIVDAAAPARSWRLPVAVDNGSSAEDYFLVCRLANSSSGRPVMMVAGLKQFGTEAASRFIVDPEAVVDTLRKVGSNWQNRNLELVFHAKVIGNSPSASELIAWHVW
jgi:hypothetical protein